MSSDNPADALPSRVFVGFVGRNNIRVVAAHTTDNMRPVNPALTAQVFTTLPFARGYHPSMRSLCPQTGRRSNYSLLHTYPAWIQRSYNSAMDFVRRSFSVFCSGCLTVFARARLVHAHSHTRHESKNRHFPNTQSHFPTALISERR